FFFFSSRRRHTRWPRDWSSDVCSSDLLALAGQLGPQRCFACSAQPNQRNALSPHLFFGAEVTHQPEHHISQAMIWEAFEKSLNRSEERRVGKESRSRMWPY